MKLGFVLLSSGNVSRNKAHVTTALSGTVIYRFCHAGVGMELLHSYQGMNLWVEAKRVFASVYSLNRRV